MTVLTDQSWASGSLSPFSGTTFGTTNGIMPKIVSGSYGGRTGSWVQFETTSSQGRCELETGTSPLFFGRKSLQSSIEEYLFDPGWPFNPTVSNPWQVLRQWKDLGSQSTTPPISIEATANTIRVRGSTRGFRNPGATGGVTGTGSSYQRTIVANPKVNTLYRIAFEVYINGPTGSIPSGERPGQFRALLWDFVAGVWREVIPWESPANGTWYMDGGQSRSRVQGGIYHNPSIGAAKMKRGRWAVGNVSLQADFDVAPGGGGGGGIIILPDPPIEPNPVVPIDVAAEVEYAKTKVGLMKSSLAAGAYPHYIDQATGRWVTTTAGGWTSGFLPDEYLRLGELTGDQAWFDAAIAALTGLAGQATNSVSAGADLGHRMRPFMRAFELLGTASYRDTVLTAADTINAQWVSPPGVFRSWASGTNGITNVNTIMDSAPGLAAVWWAARNGSAAAATLRTRLVSHFNKLQAEHVRPDGSTYHVVEYDGTGTAIVHRTVQGAGNETTWARGQAWAILGFAIASREAGLAGLATEAAAYRATAVKCANYFFNNLPEDNVPFWDFSATADKDSSAAVIAAVGMFELSKIDTTVNWRSLAGQIMESLAANYHSPATDYSILDHGTSAHPQGTAINTGLIYGDDFYLQGVVEYKGVGLGTAKPLSTLATDATWSQFPTKTSGVSVVNGRLQVTLPTTGAADEHADSIKEWVPNGDALLLGAIASPTWISGSGVIDLVAEEDWLDGNMIQTMRQITFDSASANPNKVTADTLQYRLIRPDPNAGSSDPQPAIAQWSALPPGTRHLKFGFLTDGISLQTSSSAGAVDTASFGERIKRVAPATFDTTKPTQIRLRVRRISPTDTVQIQTVTIDRALGTDVPSPNPGGSVVKTSQATRFGRNGKRIFPAITGAHWGDLAILKPITTDRVQAIAGQSRGPGGPTDAFDRADAASIATGAPVTYVAMGSKSLPSLASNKASSTTTADSRRALVDTGSNDHAVMFTITNKLPNPGAKLFNYLGIALRITITGGVSAGYGLSAALNTNGLVDFYWVPVSNSNFGGGMVGANPFAIGLAHANNDVFAARVIGNVFQLFKRTPGGILTQIGSNFSDPAASPITTGTRAGFSISGDGTNATLIDNVYIGRVDSIDEAPPFSRAGRHLRIEIGGQPSYRDSSIVPPAGVGAGLIPAGWSAVAVPRDSTSGKVASYEWDSSTGTFTMTEDAGTVGAGAAVTDLGARYVIGDREPGALTDSAANSDIAVVVPLSEKPSDAAFRGLVQPGGAITIEALNALAQAIAVYPLNADSHANGALASDQIINAKNPGTGDEIISERPLDAAGVALIGTVIIDTDAVPLAQGATGGGGGVTPVSSIPDGSGVREVSKGIDPGDPTKATVTLTMTPAADDASIGFTKHATAPHQFGYSDIGPEGAITNWLAAQASNTITVNGQPLSKADAEPTERWWTARYINNSGVAGNPQRPAVPITVVEGARSPIDEITGTIDVRKNGGIMEFYWPPAPTEDQIIEYNMKYAKTGDPFPNIVFYSGPGVPVAPGTTSTNEKGKVFDVGGMLTTPDPVTGLDDLEDYDVLITGNRLTA